MCQVLIPCWDLRNNNIQVSNSRRCRLQSQEIRHIILRSKRFKYVSKPFRGTPNCRKLKRNLLKDHLFFGHCSFYVQNGGAWNNPNSTIPIKAEWWKDSQHTRCMTGPLKACNSRNLFIDPHDLWRRQQGPRYSLGDFKPPFTCFLVPIWALNPTQR